MLDQSDNGAPALDKMVEKFRAAVRPEALRRLAISLGLSTESLGRLDIGWTTRYGGAWAFPMRSGDSGNITGIRLRLPNGRKLAVRGGHEGLFLPSGIDRGGRLLVCEGPTDTAALLDLGLPTVGRPSCTGGVKHLVELARHREPGEVVVVADGDGPGQRGAANLASVLSAYCPAVRLISPPPPFKDARAWKQAGATADDFQALIDAAPVRRLVVQVRKAGGHHG